jgi:hypothetical protein
MIFPNALNPQSTLTQIAHFWIGKHQNMTLTFSPLFLHHFQLRAFSFVVFKKGVKNIKQMIKK